MARQKNFKKGESVVLPSGYVKVVTKDQYTYRGVAVIDVKDGESETKRVPVKGVQRTTKVLDACATSKLDIPTRIAEPEAVNTADLRPHIVVNTSAPVMNKYQRLIRNALGEEIIVDVYDVLQAFQVTDPAIAHAVKKALAPGQRGHKSYEEDLNDISVSIDRAKDLHRNRQQ